MAEYKRHHDKRMAGDVFAEGSEFRDGVEKRYGKEKYAELAAAGMQDPHVGSSGTERYSGAEVRAEVREGGMDKAYYEQLKKDGAKFNGNALDFLYDEFGLNFQGGGKNKKPTSETEAPGEGEVEEGTVNEVINDITENETTSPGIPGGGSSVDGMNQDITQDNDITTEITGDNNTVENTQDNSISQTAGRSNYATRAARGLKNQYVLNLLNNWYDHGL